MAPEIEKLAAEYGDKGVQVCKVTCDATNENKKCEWVHFTAQIAVLEVACLRLRLGGGWFITSFSFEGSLGILMPPSPMMMMLLSGAMGIAIKALPTFRVYRGGSEAHVGEIIGTKVADLRSLVEKELLQKVAV